MKTPHRGRESLNIDYSMCSFTDAEVCRESQPQLGEDPPPPQQVNKHLFVLRVIQAATVRCRPLVDKPGNKFKRRKTVID